MSLFQCLLMAGVLLTAFLAARPLPGDLALALKRVCALAFAAAAVFAILFPDTLTTVAHFLGLGRGADLLLYASVMAGMLFAVALLRSKARSDARLTALTRAVALMEARLAEQHATAPENPHA